MNRAAKLVRRGSQILSGSGGSGSEVAPMTSTDATDTAQHSENEEYTERRGHADKQAMSPEQSLRNFELFEALRQFEPGTSDTDALLKAIDSAYPSNPSTTTTSSKGKSHRFPSPLHTAVRCAKPGTIDLIIRYRPGDINARDLDGQTPLHLATSLGRAEVVKILLSQPDIDDTIKDDAGRTALEVAKGHEVAKIIQVSRAQFNETYTSLLAAYVASGTSQSSQPGQRSAIPPHLSPNAGDAPLPPVSTEQGGARDALYNLISKRRARSLDFSTLTSGSKGTTIIHEAARRRDIDLLKLCQARGASMVVRDRRGKMPVDIAKDESIKALCKQSAHSEGRALRSSTSLHSIAHQNQGSPAAPATAPVMKGYLSKWTNMARGYRTRWFVLQHGHLSYYRDQEEEGQASRGVISMTVASVEMSSDKNTFTVGTKLGKSPRWFLRGNHPVEAMQWVAALKSSIELSTSISRHEHTKSIGGANQLPKSPNLHVGSAADTGSFPSRVPSANTSTSSLAIHPGRPSSSLIPSPSGIISTGASKNPSLSMSSASSEKPAFPSLDRKFTTGTTMSAGTDFEDPYTRTPSPLGTDGSVLDDDDTTAGSDTSKDRIPHEENFALLSNSAKTQAHLTEQLLQSLTASNDPGRQKDILTASQKSLRVLANMLEQHFEQVQDREKWLRRKYEREVEAKRMWEEHMRSVVSSQAELEQQLQDTQRQNQKRKKALKDLQKSFYTELSTTGQGTGIPLSPSVTAQGGETVRTPVTARPDTADSAISSTLASSGAPLAPMISGIDMQAVNEAVSDSSDDEDDFYDAIESGAVPVKVEQTIAAPGNDEWPEEFEKDPNRMLEIQSFDGYRELRDRLPITSDDRPPVSLWAILKGSIGKDLTKISFPVYFNEPTSMLQRMAEDMEYSECLDAAAAEKDSLKRLAYVTGFAMSNYASTIGRIAKPFNPMLSETFELANIQKKYRYISEQVSHHPPISACMAESPNWYYYGEVDAKSKFLGKSFEIRPTGIAHAELILPGDWTSSGTGYPPARLRKGFVREHYSWKKVTTSVSNFIMGNPQIDHYGDMEVTNHRTKERCVLTFKPRGWRGNNACEVKGTVYDKDGVVKWELAGRWNGQLVARQAGVGAGALLPDDAVPTVRDGAASPSIAPEYLLIWKINKQPPNMPFNLTKFALTLNDDKPEIKRYLPPTDCRLRPDQHAFEKGQFEKANELKSALETFQRATRHKRETGELPPHKPRWFKRGLDQDSEQGFWEPSRTDDGALEYWQERGKNYNIIQEGGQPHWDGVEEIFGVH